MDRYEVRKRKNCSGFTLLELIVVIVILGVLAAVAIPVYSLQTNRARVAAAKATVKQIQSAEARFRLENNAYSTNLTGAGANALDITVPNTIDFIFTATAVAGNPPSGTAVATGTGTTGHPAATDTVTIDLVTGAFTCGGALRVGATTVCIGD